ncbi:DUF5949 family protein [Streptomyces virginiae]|uniref:DUF5949 family protein n=1 Tax=Streptomyces virginiae TaxID=1961 RepID=UPI003651013B
MSEDTSFRPSLLGQLVSIGWIGQHPGDGGDFPMLLTFSPGDGVLGPEVAEPAIREVIAAWGLTLGSMVQNPKIDGQLVAASLDGVTVHVTGFPGLTISRPTSPEWAAIARKRGQIFFSLTTLSWPEGPTATEEQTYQFIEDVQTRTSAVSMLIPVV